MGMNKIELAQEKTLKKTRKIKIGNKEKKTVLSAEWMDAQAVVYIRERKIKSRVWRFARRRNSPQQDIIILKESYKDQQVTTSRYVGQRKGGWEKRKILEARKNSKILWNMAKEIAGKTKKKDEQVYVYDNNMIRK